MNQQGKTEHGSNRGRKRKKKKALAMGTEFSWVVELKQGWGLGGVRPRRVGWVMFERGAGPRQGNVQACGGASA